MHADLSYAPPAYECGTRPFLRWVLSHGRSPTRQAVPKMPWTPSAFPFSGRLRRRAINPTPSKRVKAWGDSPLRPEVMYPVVEHTQTNWAARNHSWSRAPHHRTQSNAKNAPVDWSLVLQGDCYATLTGLHRQKVCLWKIEVESPSLAWDKLWKIIHFILLELLLKDGLYKCYKM